MSRKTTELTTLQTRKQLLLIESELNRVQLAADWQQVKAGLEQTARQINAVTSMIESAARIGTSFTGFFQGASSSDKNDKGKKTSWISRIFNGARAGFSLWSTLKSQRR